MYAPFTFSATTARFWAREGGTSVVLSDNGEFCQSLFQAYRQETVGARRDLRPGQGVAMGATLCIADAQEQAQELRDQFDWLFNAWFVPFGFPPGLVLQGTPGTVTQQIRELDQSLSFEELFLWISTGLYEHSVMMRQIELFATKVIPNFPG